MDVWLTLAIIVVFPIVFAGMWLGVTALLGAVSGWFDLMRRYPDRDEHALLRLTWQSGSMGFGVGMRNVMILTACDTGLRVGLFKPFAVFSRDFFVPWSEISARPRSFLFFQGTELKFGAPAVGRLTIAKSVADDLARAAHGRWTEKGAFARNK